MGFFSKVKGWFLNLFGEGEEKDEGEKEVSYEKENVYADFSVRKLQRMGKKSVGITIPKEWIKAHNIDLDEEDKVMVLADSNIVIVNPKNKDEVLGTLEEVVDEEGLDKLRKDLEEKFEGSKED